jgi:hypothetical protein
MLSQTNLTVLLYMIGQTGCTVKNAYYIYSQLSTVAISLTELTNYSTRIYNMYNRFSYQI